jgi:hypothetical protein
VSVGGTRSARGRIGLYAAGFLLLLASAYALARGNLQSSLKFVWISIGLSGLAALASLLSLVLPAREPPVPPTETPDPAPDEE